MPPGLPFLIGEGLFLSAFRPVFAFTVVEGLFFWRDVEGMLFWRESEGLFFWTKIEGLFFWRDGGGEEGEQS